jgi:hypothetical protein
MKVYPKYSILVLLVICLSFGLVACGDNQPTQVAAITTPSAAASSSPTTQAVASTSTTTSPPASNVPTAATIVPTATPLPATPTPTPKPTPVPSPTPNVAIKPIADKVLLDPMAWEIQKWNNCAPMSALMAMSYFGVKKTQEECAAVLHPKSEDKNTSPAEIVDFISKNGLKTMVVENGSLDMVKKLLSNGVPVITQTFSHPNEDIGHYRVMRGYDNGKGIIILNDALMDRPAVPIDNALADDFWNAFDHRMLPVYNAKLEPVVKAILGLDAESKTNLSRALAAAESNLDKKPKDINALRNAGYLRATSGDCKGALEVWDRIVALGPISRFLWYQLWPVECSNKMGNYQQVMKLTDGILEKATVYSEARYERAVAMLALKSPVDEVKKELKHSLLDGFYQPTRDLLDKLGG